MSKPSWCCCPAIEDPRIVQRRRINAARERHYRETKERRAVLVRDLQHIYRHVGRALSPEARTAFLNLANHLEAYR